MHITLEEYFMGRDKEFPVSERQRLNAEDVVEGANELLRHFGSYRKVNSGYRDPESNKKAGGSPKSKHLNCQAIDLEDRDGELSKFCLNNLPLLDLLGLYMEHPSATPTWTHLQTVAPGSGKIVFYP
jgi:hypothetical protein